MPIDRSYRVVNQAAPDMTEPAFVASLAGTPVPASEASEAYRRIVALRVSPAFCRFVFRHESSDGTAGICPKYATKSPGNTRSSRTGKGRQINTNVARWKGDVPSMKGIYVQYDSWADGFEDVAFRIVDPGFAYAKAGATTLETILPIFAPPTDGNNPDAYIAAGVSYMSRIIIPGGIVPKHIRVAASAGHRNTAGGDAREQLQSIELTEEFYRQSRGIAGLEVVVFTPDGPDADSDPGDGMYPGTYNDLAREIVRRHATTPFDVAFAWHTEGGPEGLFIIAPYWDAANDHDTEVDGPLGELIVARMTAALGMKRRSTGVLRPGIMAEYQTGVGGQGSRLGDFASTAAIKDTCTRFVIEVGSHTQAGDLAKFNAATAAGAMIDALCAYYGIARQAPPPPADEFRFFTETGHGIGHGFKNYWETNGGLLIFGYPLTDEIDEDGQTVQYFERAVFEFHPQNPDPYRVLLRRLGAEALERKQAA